MTDELSARNLARYGLRRGAYDGARRRRFVLFADQGDGTELRREFDTKRERDDKARAVLAIRVALARAGRLPGGFQGFLGLDKL